MGRIANVEEVSRLLAYRTSDDASGVTSEILVIDGSYTAPY
jgi:hypothetical protein